MPHAKPRASNANMEQRILSILQITLDGAQPWDVCHYVSEKEQADEQPWTMDHDRKPLCERTIQRYMVVVHERISAACRIQEENAVQICRVFAVFLGPIKSSPAQKPGRRSRSEILAQAYDIASR
jgi:hypothetical protein